MLKRKPDDELIRYREIGLTEKQWAKIDKEADQRKVTQQIIFREMVAARRAKK